MKRITSFMGVLASLLMVLGCVTHPPEQDIACTMLWVDNLPPTENAEYEYQYRGPLEKALENFDRERFVVGIGTDFLFLLLTRTDSQSHQEVSDFLYKILSSVDALPDQAVIRFEDTTCSVIQFRHEKRP